MAQRWEVVRLLDEGRHYGEISRETGASTATITRIAHWLHHGTGGYREALERQGRAGRSPRPHRRRHHHRPPSSRHPEQGRLVEPTLPLLHDSGLAFEDRPQPRRPGPNFALDILFVRTDDIIEFVADGVADLGITGIDLLTETSAELPRIRELGYGRCRLEAAVPNDSPTRPRDLAGLRIATSNPNTARRSSIAGDPGRGRDHQRRGRGRAATRARRCIVDLVSTGSTLVMNGLRSIGDLLSQAVLVGPGSPSRARRRARPRATRCSRRSSRRAA